MGAGKSLTGELIYRHSRAVRVAHWVNAVCITALLVTGVFILLAHPRLYWGEDGFFDTRALIHLGSEEDDSQIGWSRSLHFLGAWILVVNGILYAAMSLWSGHLRRDLLPTRHELGLRHLAAEIGSHLRFRPPSGDAARRYNVLQKLAYLIVIFVLGPLMVLSGLAMSPALTAAYPELIWLFDGRQSARTVHFLGAAAILIFIGIHLFEVVIAGFANEMRSIITGWYRVPPESKPK